MTPRRLVLIFAAALLGVALAMGFVTRQAIELERRERDARAEAQQQESIRLSLWRMDSLLTALLARESARPYFEFQPFYPAQRAYTRMFEPVQPGEVLVPSPLLNGGDELVRLYFQLNADGSLSSPQSPSGNMRDLAESAYVAPELIIRAEERLATLSTLGLTVHLEGYRRAGRFDDAALQQGETRELSKRSQGDEARPGQMAQAPEMQTLEEYSARQRQAELSNRAPAPSPQVARVPGSPTGGGRGGGGGGAPVEAGPAADAAPNERTESGAALADKSLRDAVVDREEQQRKAASQTGRPLASASLTAAAPGGELDQGPFHAVWVRRPAGKAGPRTDEDPELLLMRRVELHAQTLHQGLWLDWPALRERLLGSVVDLLPQARIEPIVDAEASGPAEVGRLLATIPARLIPGPAPRVDLPWWTPRRATLLLSWIAMIGAGLTVFLVLRASLALSERRGRFVSAVTHELRTPLTTFCLYSQMLADDMVTDAQARREYLATLKTESRRLARVVEDVLDFARLSRPRPRPASSPRSAGDLLAQCLPELRRRCERAGLELIEDTGAVHEARLAADPRSVERILLNLVDNACKYADGPDRRLHLSARAESGRIIIRVADHGPGVPEADARRIFHPFERGRSAEHQSEPGLGLGLALSRGLAVELGGELRLVGEKNFGAVFELSLPTCAH